MSEAIELTKELISVPSITPDDDGCQHILIERLTKLGFSCTSLPKNAVSNFWAQHGSAKPLFVFAGHTDVVPVGHPQDWHTPPFKPTIKDGKLYGRGATDMKSGVAAFVIACERFIKQHSTYQGSIGLIITSGEEGNDFLDGTPVVMDYLQQQSLNIDYCLVGEPSCTNNIGDTIKNGRRGSLTGKLKIKGVQGHVAYPHLADNPIHKCLSALTELTTREWDQGDECFPPTTLQISNIQAGTGAGNVIPGEITLLFNLRFAASNDQSALRKNVHEILDNHHLNYQLDWTLNGGAFVTREGKLIDIASHAIHKVTQIKPKLSTAGGTSDGRFIAPYGGELIEFGTTNATIHQANEYVPLDEIEKLTEIYYEILTQIFST